MHELPDQEKEWDFLFKRSFRVKPTDALEYRFRRQEPDKLSCFPLKNQIKRNVMPTSKKLTKPMRRNTNMSVNLKIQIRNKRCMQRRSYQVTQFKITMVFQAVYHILNYGCVRIQITRHANIWHGWQPLKRWGQLSPTI